MLPNDEKSSVTSVEIESFVFAAQRGDSESFAKLYDIFINPIYRYVYYRVGRQDAEDLTELVFLKTWENIRQYKSGQKSFSSWLFRIAHNIVIDHYRATRLNGELSENIKDERREAEPQLLAHKHFDNVVLEKAMRELKDHYRQIVVLKYINDLSNEEIGHITGRTQTSLRILQFRALRALRRILERMGVYGF